MGTAVTCRIKSCSQCSQEFQGLAILLFLLRADSFDRGMAQEGVSADLNEARNTQRSAYLVTSACLTSRLLHKGHKSGDPRAPANVDTDVGILQVSITAFDSRKQRSV